MELAINFSYPSAELVLSGKIQVDRFKTPDWADLMSEARKYLPVYVHFAINAGADDSRTTDWALADAMARETNTPFINLHLAPREKDFAGQPESAVLDRTVRDVHRASDYFGVNRVIVENIPLGNWDEGFSPACGKPQIIREVIEQTGTGFLMDLSHARLTARHLGFDEREYISALPVKHLKEMHLTGLATVEGRLRDHMPMSEEDWIITQWAMDQIHSGRWGKPMIVAFEYGGVGVPFAWRTDPNVIASQVPRLYEMVHRQA
ncbi:MAG: DUF692 domain-containing protein [Planctomycetota bacterium]|nr:DUF692 domain-containing protein [Planctomycetota bacterium]